MHAGAYVTVRERQACNNLIDHALFSRRNVIASCLFMQNVHELKPRGFPQDFEMQSLSLSFKYNKIFRSSVNNKPYIAKILNACVLDVGCGKPLD